MATSARRAMDAPVIDLSGFAFRSDFGGVITTTAGLRALAWKKLTGRFVLK